MANLLEKDALIDVLDPGTPDIPGTPGSAPQPAYCMWVPTTVYTYGVIPGFTDDRGRVYPPQVVVTGVTTVLRQFCYPAVPGTPSTPSIPGRPATVLVNLQPGWNASAVSVDPLAASGEYLFSVPASVVGIVTGLNSVNEGSSYYEIDFGFYCRSGNYSVMERGVEKTSPASYVSTDVLAVTRSGSRIQYYKNNTLVYTSLTASYGAVFADASLYLAGDQIVDASLSATVAAAHGDASGDASGGILAVPLGFALGATNDGGDPGVPTALATGSFALTGAAESYVVGTATTGAFAVQGEAYGALGDGTGYSTCSGVMFTSMTGYSESGLLAPQYCVVVGELQQISGFSTGVYGVAGSAAGTITLQGFALSGANAGFASGDFTLVGEAYDSAAGVHGFMLGEAPAASLLGFGRIESGVMGLTGTGPVATIEARAGATMTGSFPEATITASGVVTWLGHMYGTAPAATISASGTTTWLGRMVAAYRGDYAVVARAGATMTGTGAVATISASGTRGMVGSVTGTFPQATITASGKLGIFGTVVGILPGLTVGVAGLMLGTGPRATMLGLGRVTVITAYEAYSVTLIPTEKGMGTATTHYTNYPFDRIVRWNNAYYGVAADGLYVLDGADFNGTAIVADVTTAMTDHGSPEIKHAVALHLAGRMGADLDVSVVANEEDEEYLYHAAPLIKTGARNYRCKFGKGVKARYWAYNFTNVGGEDFALDTMTPEVAVSRRTGV